MKTLLFDGTLDIHKDTLAKFPFCKNLIEDMDAEIMPLNMNPHKTDNPDLENCNVYPITIKRMELILKLNEEVVNAEERLKELRIESYGTDNTTIEKQILDNYSNNELYKTIRNLEFLGNSETLETLDRIISLYLANKLSELECYTKEEYQRFWGSEHANENWILSPTEQKNE